MRYPAFRVATSALAALTAGSIASAVAQSTIIVAPNPPPAPRVETVPPPTVTQSQTMTWVPGQWSWNGANWGWVDGQYITRPQPTARWMPGHWEQQATGGYVWVDGHWQG